MTDEDSLPTPQTLPLRFHTRTVFVVPFWLGLMLTAAIGGWVGWQIGSLAGRLLRPLHDVEILP